MSGQIYKTPLAQNDIIEIASFIADDNPDAAERFLDATEQTFTVLSSMPSMGQAVSFQNSRTKNVRIWRVENFEHSLVFYHPVDDGIEIIRVLHGARDIEAIFED